MLGICADFLDTLDALQVFLHVFFVENKVHLRQDLEECPLWIRHRSGTLLCMSAHILSEVWRIHEFACASNLGRAAMMTKCQDANRMFSQALLRECRLCKQQAASHLWRVGMKGEEAQSFANREPQTYRHRYHECTMAREHRQECHLCSSPRPLFSVQKNAFEKIPPKQQFCR